MYFKPNFIIPLSHILALLFFSGCSKDDPTPELQFSSLEEEIDYLIEQYTEVGAAVGIINKQQEQEVFFYGTKTLNEDDPPDGNTVYEIGSITKTFTATLLAEMVLNGTVALEDTVGKYLPAGQVSMPSHNGVKINLKHLATHSSGIPKRPHDSGLPVPIGYDPVNSYAAYTAAHIYDYLTNYCTLAGIPGKVYLYSNIGGGLLGHTLGIADGSSYEDILHNLILNPLGMNNTSLYITEAQQTNLAMGYSDSYQPRPDWNAGDIFHGAGFIKSSLNDMLIYLKANMGLLENTLEDAIDLSHQAHFNVGTVTYDDRPNEVFELKMGLGWEMLKDSGGITYYRHGGSTSGQAAYMGYNLSNLTGVVVLCNYRTVYNIILGDKILKAINKY